MFPVKASIPASDVFPAKGEGAEIGRHITRSQIQGRQAESQGIAVNWLAVIVFPAVMIAVETEIQLFVTGVDIRPAGVAIGFGVWIMEICGVIQASPQMGLGFFHLVFHVRDKDFGS